MSVPLNWKGRHICHTMATISVYRFFQFVFFFFLSFCFVAVVVVVVPAAVKISYGWLFYSNF